jgi:small nuclear ribonucleoprotein (snRNP)-like protein
MICFAGVSLEPSRKPLNLLLKRINNDVVIRLKNDIEYYGKMVDCDSQMNVILEGTTEFRNNAPSKNLGNAVLRGSNILYICVEHPEETK